MAPVTILCAVAVAGSGCCLRGARLDSDPRGTFTWAVPPARSDTRLLIGAGVAAVVAGLVVAVVLLLATSRADSPKTYKPFAAGPDRELRRQLREGGPFYVADPFGGRKSILFALEGDNVVALMTHTPGDENCRIRWRGSIDSFEDCHGNRLRSDQIGRYATTVEDRAAQRRIVFVDLRKELPATAPPGAPGS
jgi:hypothetical protein